jgi:hypothetical protein
MFRRRKFADELLSSEQSTILRDGAIMQGYLIPRRPGRLSPGHPSTAVALYLLANLSALQFRAGVMPTMPDL